MYRWGNTWMWCGCYYVMYTDTAYVLLDSGETHNFNNRALFSERNTTFSETSKCYTRFSNSDFSLIVVIRSWKKKKSVEYLFVNITLK